MSTSLTIRDRLQSPELADQLRKALPKHITAERFSRVAITALTRTPKLAECDQASFFSSLLTLGQFGLEPDGRHAHLIPYGKTCQVIIDYKGLVDLAMRSGVVAYLHADVVCENDEFDYDRGQLIRHRIDFKKPRGAMYAVYALCRFKDGSEKVEVLHVDEVEGIRKRSKAGETGPWKTDYSEMAKKTAFRRLSKWLPLSPEFRDALDIDSDSQPLPVEEKPKVKFEIAAPTAPERSQLSKALEAAMTKAGVEFAGFKDVWSMKYSERAPDVSAWGDLTDEEIQDVNERMDVRDGAVFWKNGGGK